MSPSGSLAAWLRRRGAAGRPDLDRAVHAAPRGYRDRAEALRALALGRLPVLLRQGQQPAHRNDHEEVDHGRDDREGEHGIDEGAVTEGAVVDREGKPGEVGL